MNQADAPEEFSPEKERVRITTASPAADSSQPSKGESLTAKIGLALFTFLLGLLASYITSVIFAPQRQASYSTSHSRLITASTDIPEELPISKELIATANTVTRIDHVVENTGRLESSNFNILAVLPAGTEVLAKRVATTPPREVSFTEEAQKNPLEFRISAVTLEPQQRFALKRFTSAQQRHRRWQLTSRVVVGRSSGFDLL
jgi:hypothetical protein